MMVSKGNHPDMASIQVSEILRFAQTYQWLVVIAVFTPHGLQAVEICVHYSVLSLKNQAILEAWKFDA